MRAPVDVVLAHHVLELGQRLALAALHVVRALLPAQRKSSPRESNFADRAATYRAQASKHGTATNKQAGSAALTRGGSRPGSWRQ